MTRGGTADLVRLVILLYAAGDVDRIREAWHPDIEVTTYLDRERVLHGRDEVAGYVRGLLAGDRVDLDPESVRIAGTDALVDGQIVFEDGRASLPVTWLWSFRDGLLWRSVTFERSRPVIAAASRAAVR